MKPEFSRRIAWVIQFLKTDPRQQGTFIRLVETANDFSELPTELQDLILAVEEKVGTNPNL
jgi:hypothetical protein